jgi:two-component system sensor kinase FixL
LPEDGKVYEDTTSQPPIFRGFSRRRELLTHLQRVHTVGEMGGALAHELSQPLYAIQNYLSGARRRLARGEHPRQVEAVADAMEQATAEVTRAAGIVARLRDFVRRNEPHRSTVDVEAVLREALKLMEPEIRGRRARLDFQFDTDVATMLVDPVQVQQVVVNLVRNALEAMTDAPSEGRELAVTARSVQEGFVEFAVRDTGPGLARDLAGRLFAAFATTKQGGLGMGLAISRSIVKSHGGEIWFTENEPHGAAFHFTLPRVFREYSDEH